MSLQIKKTLTAGKPSLPLPKKMKKIPVPKHHLNCLHIQLCRKTRNVRLLFNLVSKLKFLDKSAHDSLSELSTSDRVQKRKVETIQNCCTPTTAITYFFASLLT